MKIKELIKKLEDIANPDAEIIMTISDHSDNYDGKMNIGHYEWGYVEIDMSLNDMFVIEKDK